MFDYVAEQEWACMGDPVYYAIGTLIVYWMKKLDVVSNVPFKNRLPYLKILYKTRGRKKFE